MKEIKRYIKRHNPNHRVVAHLYDMKLDMDIVLFGLYDDDDLTRPYIYALNSPSGIYGALSFVELDMVDLDIIDEVFENCVLVRDSRYIGMNYKKVKKIFEGRCK